MNIQNSEGDTALIIAAKQNDIDIFYTLKNAGADTSIKIMMIRC